MQAISLRVFIFGLLTPGHDNPSSKDEQHGYAVDDVVDPQCGAI